MKRYKLALLLSFMAASAIAKPVINMTPDTKGGISKTIVETWNLSEDEKKNTALMMSQLSAIAIAPTTKIKTGSWTALSSQHKSCFYNTFQTQVTGKYSLKFDVAGKEVTAFDAELINPGQAICVTRYLEIWVKGERPGDSPSNAYTHIEMDGNATDNEGHGTITVR